MTDESRENSNHALILTVQHTIGDGRNCYEIGVQLLNIIGALLEGQECAEMDGDFVTTFIVYERGVSRAEADSI
jgi:hypothetical protein